MVLPDCINLVLLDISKPTIAAFLAVLTARARDALISRKCFFMKISKSEFVPDTIALVLTFQIGVILLSAGFLIFPNLTTN